MNDNLFAFIKVILENLVNLVADSESVNAILLAQTRILYKNQELVGKISEIKDRFVKVHKEAKDKT